MTIFTRIVDCTRFVAHGHRRPERTPNQIIIGLSLFLTFFLRTLHRANQHRGVGSPIWRDSSLRPVAIEKATVPLKAFYAEANAARDLSFFLQLGRFPPTRIEELPMRVVIPRS